MNIEIDLPKPSGKIVNKRVKYWKYLEAIAPHIEFLKSLISSSPDGFIRLKTEDFAIAIGIKKSPNSVYQGLKYVLFFEGIVVNSGKSKNEEHMLILRTKNDRDQLPLSLQNVEKNLDERLYEFKIYDIF
jgi:hypothetical protein